jgi:predicted amidophosphoribosyltransferase
VLKPVLTKTCDACGRQYETIYRFQRLCWNCRLNREVEKYKKQYYAKKLKALRRVTA